MILKIALQFQALAGIQSLSGFGQGSGKETRKRDGVGTLHQHQDQLIKQGMRPLKNSPCRKGRSVTIKRQTRAVAGSSSLRRA